MATSMDPFICDPLKAFPELLRVEGIAPIKENGQLGAKVKICFSKLNEKGLDAPYSESSLDGACSVTVSTRWLHILTIGSTWLQGRRIHTPDIFDTPFLIDASQARTVSLKESIKLNKSWINTAVPIKGINSGENAIELFSTLYVVVPVINDPKTQWLVVPSSELLRFYTAASSRIIPKTLKGQLGDYVDWDKSRAVEDKVILHGREDLSRTERAMFARAVSDPIFRAALFMPHQYLAKVKANNSVLPSNRRGPLTIKAEFPFNDMSMLRVAGVRMKFDEKDDNSNAVFSMEIIQCNHTLGFSSIEFHSFTAQLGQGSSTLNESNHKPQFNPAENDEDDDVLLDTPADSRLRRQTLLVTTNPFPDLLNIDFSTVRPGVNEGNQPSPAIQVSIDGRSMAEGETGEENHNILGINSSTQLANQTNQALVFFLDMLHYLRKSTTKRGWTITTRRLSSFIIHNKDSITFFPHRVAKKHSWHKIVEPNGSTRTRQVVWAEIISEKKDKYFYLLELESKSDDKHCTLLLHNKDFSLLSDSNFNLFLKLTAIRNRWLHGKNNWKTEKIKLVADKLLSSMKLHAIDHPKINKQKFDSQQNSELINSYNGSAKLWSEFLKTEVDRYFSSLRKT